MSSKVEDEAANWTKAISGLTITKCGLIFYIIESLKNFLKSFSSEQIDHLSEFLDNTRDSKLEFKKEKGKKGGSWKIAEDCCKTGLCQTILDLLWEQHVNKSKHVVWSPIVKKSSDLYTLNTKKATLPYTYILHKECSVCGEFNCQFERNRSGIRLFDDTLEQGDVDKYYWQVANMYMFHGKETINFPNTGPEDTDVALIFKLMKNCKLFSLDEDDIDNRIYEDLLEVRNLLMHNADNRLTDAALEVCFERMKRILKANMFSSEHIKKAITELEKQQDMRIIMTSLTSKQEELVRQAFNLQQSSVKFDIQVRGSLKNDYVLEGILKASKDNFRKYTGDADQNPAPPSHTPAPPSKSPDPPRGSRKSSKRDNTGTAAGATTGAVIGSIGGPAGSVLGAAVGGLFGKLFD